MNLNKPPVSKEQTALEEYVSFLLEDRTNVLPLRRQTNPSRPECVVTKVRPAMRSPGASKDSRKGSPPSVPRESSERLASATPVPRKPPRARAENDKQTRELRPAGMPASQTKDELESLAASIEAGGDYHGHVENPDPRLAGVQKLLTRISRARLVSPPSQETNQVPSQNTTEATKGTEFSTQAEVATFIHRETLRSKDILPELFQTLIFKVAQVPLAVPLLKLGGIINVSAQDVTPLVGTPDWFIGLVPNERGNLMVVDTQKYLMPGQAGSDYIAPDYDYLIILDDSRWALACNSVGDAKNLTHDDVRWSAKSSTKPWFAGMVFEYMSALVEVDELINMLMDNILD